MSSQPHPVDVLGRWFAEPLVLGGDRSVAGVLDALNQHAFAQDESAQDYVMPARRYREQAGRFRIWGENQDTFYCYVRAEQAGEADPPVYFETCLDLARDHGYDPAEIVDGDSVLVCPRFTTFLWHMLGHSICLRLEPGDCLAEEVNGVTFSGVCKMDASFVNPLGHEFPAGFTCYFGTDAICIPDWGAAFRTQQAREAFLNRFRPELGEEW